MTTAGEGEALTSEEGKRKPSDLWFLLVLAVIAVALRFAAISYRHGYLGWDETMYLMLGKNFLSGAGYQLNGPPNITFPPLLPIIGGAVLKLTGSLRWALSAPSAILGGLAVVPVFLLAGRMFSRSAAMSAAIVFAGLRPLLMYTPFCWYKHRLYAGSEEIFLFIVCWALYFFWRAWEDESITFAALGGLACGIGFLARQEALGLWGGLLTWLLFVAVVKRRVRWNLLARIVAGAAAFLAVSAPFFIYSRSVTGHFTFGPHLSHNIVVREAFKEVYFHDDWRPFLGLYLSLNADKTDYENSYYGVLPGHVESGESYSDAGIITRLLKGVDVAQFKYWLADMNLVFPWYLLPFVFIGFIDKSLSGFLTRAGFAAVTVAPAILIATTLLVLPRYNIYLGGLIVVLAAGGLVKTSRGFAACIKSGSKAVPFVAAGVIASIGIYQAFAFSESSAAAKHREHHIRKITPLLAADISRLAAPGTRVLCHDPQAILHSNTAWMPLPMAPFDDVVEFAANRGVPLIVLKKKDTYGGEHSRSLRTFSLEEAVAHEATVVVSDEMYDDERIVILEVGMALHGQGRETGDEETPVRSQMLDAGLQEGTRPPRRDG